MIVGCSGLNGLEAVFPAVCGGVGHRFGIGLPYPLHQRILAECVREPWPVRFADPAQQLRYFRLEEVFFTAADLKLIVIIGEELEIIIRQGINVVDCLEIVAQRLGDAEIGFLDGRRNFHAL